MKKLTTATIKFSSRAAAQDLANKWSRVTFRGYTLSATGSNGETAVTLDKVTAAEREWLDAKIDTMNRLAALSAE